MDQETKTIWKHGYCYTYREVPLRPKSVGYDSIGKVVTKHVDQPCFAGMRDMALISCRKLTRSEKETLNQNQIARSMQIEKDGDAVLMHLSSEESEIIKESLICFFNSKTPRASTPETEQDERERRKADKKIAFRIHSEFTEITNKSFNN